MLNLLGFIALSSLKITFEQLGAGLRGLVIVFLEPEDPALMKVHKRSWADHDRGGCMSSPSAVNDTVQESAGLL